MPVRIAALVRVSTQHLEQADSPQHQLSYIAAEVERQGWVDSGLSYRAELTGAVILGRPDIQRMLEDARAHAFDAIVLKSISRLGRDTLGLLMVKRMLDDLGVELIALSDGYRSSRDPELIFLVHAERAQAGRQEIAKNVRAGIREAARRGIWPAGWLPFGFRRTGRFEIVPDPETAPVARLIFQLRLQGWGLTAIARHLNHDLQAKAPQWHHLQAQCHRLAAKGEADRDNRLQARIQAIRQRLAVGSFRWQPRTIRLILTNTAYYGELRYNRTTGERHLHGRLCRRPQAEGEWVTIACPPLIARDDWAKAQGIAPERARLPRRSAASPFLLSGLVTCGQCGNRMRTLSARPGAGARGGEPKGYYLCRGSSELRLHASEYIRASELEAAVLERLRAELAGLAPPRAIGRRRVTGRTAAAAGARSAAALEADLRDMAEARFFRREELRKGRMSEAEFQFELDAIRQRESQLQAELAVLRLAVQTPGEVAGGAACAATLRATGCREPSLAAAVVRLMRLEGPPADLKRLLLTLVERVVVWDRHRAEVHVRFTQAEVAEKNPCSSVF